MGTSNRWTAADTQAWRRAQEQAANDAPIEDVAKDIADALVDDDPGLREPISQEPLFDFDPSPFRLPRGPAGGSDGPGGIGGGLRTVSGRAAPADADGGGRGRTRTHVVRGASRGGAAIGAAYAFQRGDAAALRDDYGLDLDDLASKTPRERADAILDVIVGDSGSPDDAALRKVLLVQLARVVGDDTPPAAPDVVRQFVGEYVTELGVRRLASGLSDDLTTAKVERVEREFKGLVKVHINRLDLPASGRISKRDLMALAENVAKKSIDVLTHLVDEAK